MNNIFNKKKNLNRFFKIHYFLRKFYSFKFINLFLSENYVRKNIFKYIFSSGYWSDYDTSEKKSVSGKGSNFENASYLKNELEKFFRENKIKKILDIGCGDFNWMSKILENVEYEKYVGVDIVKNLIEDNLTKYGSKKISFICKDIVAENFEPFEVYDLILIRHVFIHLKNSNIIKVLNKIKKIKYNYLAVTSDPHKSKNLDLKTEGRYRDINLTIEPFNFIGPLKIIKESAPGIINNVDLNIYKN